MLEEIPAFESPPTIKVVTTGRTSKLPHVVEVRFMGSSRGFYVFGAAPRSDWVLNALSSGQARVRVGELSFPCSVRRASPQEAESTYDLFKKKYGDRIVNRWYGDATACLLLEFAGRPERKGAGSGESDTKVDYRSWKSLGRDYYTDVAAAFDSASEEYDFTISRNFINTWIRRRSLEVLDRYLRKEDAALEIGCGTGAETLQIAKSVRTVVATDISERMVSLLGTKVRARKATNVIPLRLGAAEIALAASYLEGGRASVAYSLNGALNCEPKLDSFVAGLAELLPPGGHFICSVRNILCLSEVAIHAFLLQFDRAMLRVRQPTMVSVGGMDIPSTYYSPSDFASHFEPFFRVREMMALPALLPPAYLSNYYVRLRAVLSPLEALEKVLAGRPPFNRLGDQTLFVFQKLA
ncbi:MAG: methyltransferase domain-containing protein [Nitrososphaerales archaeon]|nr:methyltransferase domain-containing protein [Nitrososphaerales archaeon]